MYELKDYHGQLLAYINPQNITTINYEFDSRIKLQINGKEFILFENSFMNEDMQKVWEYFAKIIKDLTGNTWERGDNVR